jgi:hypothetical protein
VPLAVMPTDLSRSGRIKSGLIDFRAHRLAVGLSEVSEI